ncbi:MAG: 1-acyl-sn-glycerol-3-phosphate acyltransferase [Levilactobacillus sp.]|jgi:1-acyl-sn-glycerol-3-phosphate acyltransferase|uniref:lysophospholipid acyltransferase family protein n=1 Tax=Levilactobacillus sp. TaxID=2767919 RepID=UPI00258AB919|nr:1-acyl-sn-glycerol-3-phosphate acyltransferase [Levilactobacillus sp.]MCI1553185.1 1-acyl-sn-glycerol-3-phosphate acyltransferase [Levilactobacillus sp.]MCI1599607.1 1-acyl-sn-glycerol-3-phosphate acyltransferase [Levilactobacillus sp.]MCI1605118.1 1-acyl-sn-glycerol-3-phosphate acyltransferase [Levilactobacillus sp.]
MRQKTYRTFHDDLVTSRHQDWQLPADYDWRLPGRAWQRRWFRRLAKGISRLYVHTHAITIKNGWRLTTAGPCVVYGNHTQPTGDVLLPLYLGATQRFNVLASPANLGIPVIGPLTVFGGAVPTPQTLTQMRAFRHAVHQKLAAGEWLMVYPEEHVWPYYPGIRPFNSGAFHFPIGERVPAYTITVTYRRRWLRHPRQVVYVDGPFRPDPRLSPKQQQRQLAQMVTACMAKRTATTNVSYVHYEEVSR